MPTLKLRVFATHCTTIALAEVGDKFTLHPMDGDLRIFVEIVSDDDVRFDGVSQGNRSGAIHEYAKRLCDAMPTVDLEREEIGLQAELKSLLERYDCGIMVDEWNNAGLTGDQIKFVKNDSDEVLLCFDTYISADSI